MPSPENSTGHRREARGRCFSFFLRDKYLAPHNNIHRLSIRLRPILLSLPEYLSSAVYIHTMSKKIWYTDMLSSSKDSLCLSFPLLPFSLSSFFNALPRLLMLEPHDFGTDHAVCLCLCPEARETNKEDKKEEERERPRSFICEQRRGSGCKGRPSYLSASLHASRRKEGQQRGTGRVFPPPQETSTLS